ncbi:hypothetical protein D3C73_949710 [compost metagenome]
MRNRRKQEIVIQFADQPGCLSTIISCFAEQGIQIDNMQLKSEKIDKRGQFESESLLEIKFSLQIKQSEKLPKVIENISQSVQIITMETGQLSTNTKLNKKTIVLNQEKEILR